MVDPYKFVPDSYLKILQNKPLSSSYFFPRFDFNYDNKVVKLNVLKYVWKMVIKV